ncbi:MAG: hypothetical protein KF763_14045 [Cyclobacteriaceae bacterium]|nr:hypothetical protein [Cyclobacteriaceae bacterium]
MNYSHQPAPRAPQLITLRLLIYFVASLMFNEALANDTNWRIVFNQPQYALGDTAHFAVVGINSKHASRKSVLTIKLLDKQGNSFFYNRILMTEGFSAGYLLFPDQMPAGVLTMVIIPEVVLESDFFAYTVNWFVSENGTLVPLTGKSMIETCKNITINMDSIFMVRDKVEINVKGERINNLIVSAYNKQVFADFNNNIYVEPDRVVPNSNLKTSARWPYYFRGRVVPESTQKSTMDSIAITIYLSKVNLVYKVFTNKAGIFDFPLFMDFEDDWIFYKTTYKNQTIDATIELENVTINPPNLNVDTSNFKLEYSSYNNIRKSVENSYNFFRYGEGIEEETLSESDIITDIDVNIEKYEPFNTMYDVFLNVVPMVRYRIGEPDQLRVFLKKTAGYAMADPLYIINGYMTNQTELIAGLDPRFIKRIGVLRTDKTLARFGELGSNGIIIIETKANVELTSKNTLFIKGITKHNSVSKTIELDSKSPDLRPSVFWWAGTKPPAAGFSFYTSNAPGQYLLQAFFTGNEKFCNLKKSFQVSISK